MVEYSRLEFRLHKAQRRVARFYMPSVTESATHATLVTTYLDAFFARKIAAAREIHPRYETLWREIARVSSQGKRLRPLMLLMAYEAFGGNESSGVIPAAAACELLHVSMLVHDDIIDRDMMRHGEPTIQAAYETRYAGEVKRDADRQHNAVAAAILAGDLLLSEARSLITKAESTEDAIRAAGYIFDQAVFEVAGGELLDVESSATLHGSVSSLIIMTYKTASYSFIGPLLIGATLGGASLGQQKLIRSFALNLGIAYQLTDDILGVFGDTVTTGKPNDSDIHEGKATYLVERFYGLASADKVAEFETIYGSSTASAEDCHRIRELFASSGALGETERLVRSYTEQANRDLTELSLDTLAHDSFSRLVASCTDRSS